MEDTPSNYNIANQRFDNQRPDLDYNVEQIEEESDGGEYENDAAGGDMLQKKKRKKKKKKV